MIAPPSPPYVCVLYAAGSIVGAEVLSRPDFRKIAAAALALALVRLDCDSYEVWHDGKMLDRVKDKLAKANDLLFQQSDVV